MHICMHTYVYVRNLDILSMYTGTHIHTYKTKYVHIYTPTYKHTYTHAGEAKYVRIMDYFIRRLSEEVPEEAFAPVTALRFNCFMLGTSLMALLTVKKKRLQHLMQEDLRAAQQAAGMI
jgi:hypothetical protein